VNDGRRISLPSLLYVLRPYSKDGKEILLPSFTGMLDFFAAAGVDIEAVSPKELVVKHFGTDGKFPVFDELTGKVMKFGIRKLLTDDYKEPTESKEDNEVSVFADKDGKAGSEIRGAKNAMGLDAFKKMIDKKPVKDSRKLSKSGAAAPVTGGSEQPSAMKAW